MAAFQKVAVKVHDLIVRYDVSFKLAKGYLLLTPSARWWLLQGFALTTHYCIPKSIYFQLFAGMLSDQWSFSELKALAALSYTILHRRAVSHYSGSPVIVVQKSESKTFQNCYVYFTLAKKLYYYTSEGKRRSLENTIIPKELTAIKTALDKNTDRCFSNLPSITLADCLIERKNHLFFKSAYEQQCDIRFESRIKRL